jgi:hypothetical protein
MSITWWNCDRSPPVSLIRAGHELPMGLRVPPKCDATCFIYWNGDDPAQAQGTG